MSSTTVPKSKIAEHGPKPTSGHLFFLDVSGSRIMSLNPDGSNLQAIVTKGLRIPDGVAVDADAGHIYWTNMGNPSANDGSIDRCDLDGSNVTNIIPPGGTFTPKQLQLDKSNGKLYWSDREGMRVMRARLYGSALETLVETGRSDADRPDLRNWCVGIAVDTEGRKFYWTQKGPDNAGQGRVFRANLEIPNGQSPSKRKAIEILFDGLPEPTDLHLPLPPRILHWPVPPNTPRATPPTPAP